MRFLTSMGNITLTIRKVDYTIACADGDEARVQRLGNQLNDHVSKLAQQFPRADDTLLLVMASLMILDSHAPTSTKKQSSNKAKPTVTEKDIGELSQRLRALIHQLKGGHES